MFYSVICTLYIPSEHHRIDRKSVLSSADETYKAVSDRIWTGRKHTRYCNYSEHFLTCSCYMMYASGSELSLITTEAPHLAKYLYLRSLCDNLTIAANA